MFRLSTYIGASMRRALRALILLRVDRIADIVHASLNARLMHSKPRVDGLELTMNSDVEAGLQVLRDRVLFCAGQNLRAERVRVELAVRDGATNVRQAVLA